MLHKHENCFKNITVKLFLDNKGFKTIKRENFYKRNHKKSQKQRRVIEIANNNQNQNQGNMSREEAGRKGGEKTSRKYDHEHFENIGQKGGETTSQEYDQDHFENIGQKGGETTSKKYGEEHYEKIGSKGGRTSGKGSNNNSNS